MNHDEQSQQKSYSTIFSTSVLLSKLLYYNLQTLACYYFFILVREDLANADDLPPNYQMFSVVIFQSFQIFLRSHKMKTLEFQTLY